MPVGSKLTETCGSDCVFPSSEDIFINVISQIHHSRAVQ